MNIYVSNLDQQITSENLKDLFSAHGEVASAEIAIDGFTDKPRGFGYVEMPEEVQARAAISVLDQTEVSGHLISVREAAPREKHKGSYKVGSGPITQYRFKKN